jgi:hypothetical protein
MKTTKFLFVLFAFVGFIIVSCSDEPQSPITPGESGSLKKVVREPYDGTEALIQLIDPGRQKVVNGKLIIQHMQLLERLETTTAMVTGEMFCDLSIHIDIVTGEGHMSGGGTVTPDDPSVGGVWHWSFNAERVKTGESEWTATLHLVGHGQGGVIQGWQLFATGTQLSWDVLGTYWEGTVDGYMQYNEN